MRPCEICGRPGQCHHIIFRSHGGMNIELNYAWLCADHHTVLPDSVHRCRAFDLLLKTRLQRNLEELFREPEYGVSKIAKLVGYDRRRLACRMKRVPKHCGKYRREDVITFFMGGKLYADLRPAKEDEGLSELDPAAGFVFLEDEECFTWNGKN